MDRIVRSLRSKKLRHSPCPESNEDYLKSTGAGTTVEATDNQSYFLTKLPLDISAMIFSFLGPAALDAARCTCSAWRNQIMNDTWILRSVLGNQDSPLMYNLSGAYINGKPKRAGEEGYHRYLLKKLDIQSSLLATYKDLTSWRTRYRERTINFTIQSPQHHPNKHSVRKAYFIPARLCNTIGFFVLSRSTLTRKMPHSVPLLTMDLYHVSLLGQVTFVRTLISATLRGDPEIQNITESDFHRAWNMIVRFGNTVRSFSIATNETFSGDDIEFIVKSSKFSQDAEAGQVHENKIGKVGTGKAHDVLSWMLHKMSKSWELLAHLPNHRGQRVFWIDDSHLRAQELIVAMHKETGEMCVGRIDYVVNQVSGHKPILQESVLSEACHRQVFQPTLRIEAVLSPPKNGSVFKNVAAASALLYGGVARIGVIWQEPSLDIQRTELYIYDIMGALHSTIRHSVALDSKSPFRVSGASIKWAGVDGRHIDLCDVIQGKRITSLDPLIGGIHPASPVKHLSKLKLPKGKDGWENALGGLQVVVRDALQEEREEKSHPLQRILVWGPTKADGSCIGLHLFDNSPADPDHLRAVDQILRGSYLGNCPWRKHYCACPKHDDVLGVSLPDTPGNFASVAAAVLDPQDSIPYFSPGEWMRGLR